MQSDCYAWNNYNKPINKNLTARLRNRGIEPSTTPGNIGIIDALLEHFNPSRQTHLWAGFASNSVELVRQVEHSFASTFCFATRQSVNLISPTIIENTLKKATEDSPEKHDITAGRLIVFSDINKPRKSFLYSQGELHALFKLWLEGQRFVLFTFTFQQILTGVARDLTDIIKSSYGDLVGSLVSQATIFTHQVEKKEQLSIKRI